MPGTYLENVRRTVPLVHNITSYVTVNDVANVLLACGASPIMSDEPIRDKDLGAGKRYHERRGRGCGGRGDGRES